MPEPVNAAGPAPRPTSLRVLLVEDEATIAVTLGDDLVDRGHRVTLLADGVAALRRLDAARFDAVISDLRLPGADGITVLERARRHNP
ncbi:MAG: response regulator, partial [Planctomycetes bacterium]|nr:response regulator [Planctomycetota bacterium]